MRRGGFFGAPVAFLRFSSHPSGSLFALGYDGGMVVQPLPAGEGWALKRRSGGQTVLLCQAGEASVKCTEW